MVNIFVMIFILVAILGMITILSFGLISFYGFVKSISLMRYMKNKNKKRHEEIWGRYYKGLEQNFIKWYFKKAVPYIFNNQDCDDKEVLSYKRKLRTVLKTQLYLGIIFGITILLAILAVAMSSSSFE